MDENKIKCPGCGIGELISEIVRDNPNGEHDEIYFYSCGHRHYNCTIPTVTVTYSAEISKVKLKSGEKISDKPKYEIEERHKKDDIDNPNVSVWQIFYINRKSSPKSVFQVIKYESGEIKHVHCKICNSEYRYNSIEKLEDLFSVDLRERSKIECLRCHAKFEQ